MVEFATKSPGGGIYSSGNLVIANSTISSNDANYGGGIYLDNYGNQPLKLKADIVDSTVSDNNGENSAGGIVNYYGDLTIKNSTINLNKGRMSSGGGISNSGTLKLIGGKISGNGATGEGGGVMNYGTFTVESGLISDNIAYNGPAGTWYTGKGGGIYNSGTAYLKGGSISGNNAYDGAGIYNSAGTLFVGGTIHIISNEANSGGGIYSGNSQVTFDGPGVVVQSNKACLPSPSELSWHQGWGYTSHQACQSQLMVLILQHK